MQNEACTIERVSIIFLGSEGIKGLWDRVRQQITPTACQKRASSCAEGHVVITDHLVLVTDVCRGLLL